MATLTLPKNSEFDDNNVARGTDVRANDQAIQTFLNGHNLDDANLNLAMTPTWTGAHIFSNTVTFNSTVVQTNSNTTTGHSITQSAVLAASNYGFYLYSNAIQVNAPLAFIHQDNASSTANVVELRNDSSSDSYTLALRNSSTIISGFKEDGALVLPQLSSATLNELTQRSGNKGYVSWRFDTPPTLLTSYNVTGVTRNGTGDDTIAWSTNFSANDYCLAALVRQGGSPLLVVGHNTSPMVVGSSRIVVETTAGSGTDANYVSVVAFGDK